MKEKLERFWEPIVGGAALATVPFLLFEGQMDPSTLFMGDVIIWSIFTMAFLSVLLTCRDRAERIAWVRKSWLELLIIIGSFPILPDSLQSIRLLRLGRFARFLRLGRLLAVTYFLKWTRQRFALSPVAFAGTTTVVLAILGANALHILEPDLAPDLGVGLWWAITTMTTVGYGDIAPESLEGRFVGGFLMVFGVAIMASFSGYLASFLVAENEESTQNTVEERLDSILFKIERLEALVAQGSNPQEAGPLAATETPSQLSKKKATSLPTDLHSGPAEG